MGIRRLLEILLNDINEFSATLYLRHVHGGAVADLFLGDDVVLPWCTFVPPLTYQVCWRLEH